MLIEKAKKKVVLMKTRLLNSLAVALGACSFWANTGAAVDRMVGLVPSDGVALFVKAFPVAAGTTILGAQFVNNDPATVFPVVVLVRGGENSLWDGTTVASVANVREASGGVVTVTWPSPVVASEAGTYRVGVCSPAGTGKQGLGQGPALGADDIDSPNGSYVACGSSGELVPLASDFAISLTTSATGGQSKASNMPSSEQPVRPRQTFLTVRQGASSSVTLDFELATSGPVTLRIYDVTGRVVRDLAHRTFEAGAFSHAWDGRSNSGSRVSAGIYFVRLSAGSVALNQRVVLRE